MWGVMREGNVGGGPLIPSLQQIQQRSRSSSLPRSKGEVEPSAEFIGLEEAFARVSTRDGETWHPWDHHTELRSRSIRGYAGSAGVALASVDEFPGLDGNGWEGHGGGFLAGLRLSVDDSGGRFFIP